MVFLRGVMCMHYPEVFENRDRDFLQQNRIFLGRTFLERSPVEVSQKVGSIQKGGSKKVGIEKKICVYNHKVIGNL